MESIQTIFGLREQHLQKEIHYYDHTNFQFGLQKNCPYTFICFTEVGQPYHFINFKKINIRIGGFYFIPAHQHFLLPFHPETKLLAYTFPWFSHPAYCGWAQSLRFDPDKFIPKDQLLPLEFNKNSKDVLAQLEWILQRINVSEISIYEKMKMLYKSVEFLDLILQKKLVYGDFHVPSIAKQLNMGERNFQRMCEIIYKRTPLQIFEYQLLLHIAEHMYLNPHEPMEETRKLFGFPNDSGFSRYFKRGMGLNTTEFKKQFFL